MKLDLNVLNKRHYKNTIIKMLPSTNIGRLFFIEHKTIPTKICHTYDTYTVIHYGTDKTVIHYVQTYFRTIIKANQLCLPVSPRRIIHYSKHQYLIARISAQAIQPYSL